VALCARFLAGAASGAFDLHPVRPASGEDALVDGAVLLDESVVGLVQRLAFGLGAAFRELRVLRLGGLEVPVVDGAQLVADRDEVADNGLRPAR
jgi:hypothetical protein